MPVILRFKNIRFVIVPGDHGHPHVHVLGKSAQAKFRLDIVECMESKGFTKQALNEIERQILIYQSLLLEAWNDWQN